MISAAAYIRRLLAQSWEPNRLLHHLAVRRALTGCQSVLDVGCGADSCVAQMGIPRLIGVEPHPASAFEARLSGHYIHVMNTDARHLSYFHTDEFDACACLDVIEHLPKEYGCTLLKELERISSDRVVITTPNGFLPQDHLVPGDYQQHLSGWTPDDFRVLGYEVHGLLGHRALRGTHHHLRYRPKSLFGLISLLSQILYTKHHPDRATSLIAVKKAYIHRSSARHA